MTRQVLLWGDTQVGKTALMATALCSEPARPRHINKPKSAAELAKSLQRHWDLLQTCEAVEKTLTNTVDVCLTTHRDQIVQFRDIKGGNTRDFHKEEIHGLLQQCSAILFIVEMSSPATAEHMRAVRAALQVCGDLPKALVLTKCEKHLPLNSAAWDALSGWWTKIRLAELAHYADVLKAFGDAVFPTSAYGYSNCLQPAVILGEFGELIPYQVKPQGVWEPFEWIMDELGVQ